MAVRLGAELRCGQRAIRIVLDFFVSALQLSARAVTLLSGLVRIPEPGLDDRASAGWARRRMRRRPPWASWFRGITSPCWACARHSGAPCWPRTTVPALPGRSDELPLLVAQYGSSRETLGSTLAINGVAVTIAGIAPPEFFGER